MFVHFTFVLVLSHRTKADTVRIIVWWQTTQWCARRSMPPPPYHHQWNCLDPVLLIRHRTLHYVVTGYKLITFFLICFFIATHFLMIVRGHWHELRPSRLTFRQKPLIGYGRIIVMAPNGWKRKTPNVRARTPSPSRCRALKRVRFTIVQVEKYFRNSKSLKLLELFYVWQNCRYLKCN